MFYSKRMCNSDLWLSKCTKTYSPVFRDGVVGQLKLILFFTLNDNYLKARTARNLTNSLREHNYIIS